KAQASGLGGAGGGGFDEAVAHDHLHDQTRNGHRGAGQQDGKGARNTADQQHLHRAIMGAGRQLVREGYIALAEKQADGSQPDGGENGNEQSAQLAVAIGAVEIAEPASLGLPGNGSPSGLNSRSLPEPDQASVPRRNSRSW